MVGFEKLNDMQKKAVLAKEGPVLLLAGAGSGKTGALTVRIAHLIESGVNPYNILAITFTNKAAKEMKERVLGLAPEQGVNVFISTFHSTCVRILRRDIDKIGYDKNFSIYDADDMDKIAKEVFKRLNYVTTDKVFTVRYALGQISKLKEELISFEDYLKEASGDPNKIKIANFYKLYQEILKNSNALDFDDLIYKTVILFRNCPEVLNSYQERFNYIMVDEYQDTNTSQYQLVRMLADKYKNLCVVGDDDQSIYGWRGANIRNILDFEKDFPNTTVIKLEQNYRSTKNILEVANTVIKNNVTRKVKFLWTENDQGSIINLYKSETERTEAGFICNKIFDLNAEGRSYNDFAILYRTNAQSRVFEDLLVKRNIPYRLVGGVRFYERKEIRDIMGYLKTLANSFDDIAIKRIINVPKRGIGDLSVDKVSAFAIENQIPFYEALGRTLEIIELKTRGKKLVEFYELIESLKAMVATSPVVDIINAILEKTGYLNELNQSLLEEDKARVENIQEFISKAVEFGKTSEDPTLFNFLEEVALVADIDSYSEDVDSVVLMTLHSSKGLEFPYVFLTGLEEGVFPSYRSINYGTANELEEERRLCYVGITRAREELFITHARSRLQHGNINYNSPSRFLKELPKELINVLTETVQPRVDNKNKTPFKKYTYDAGPKKSVNEDLPKPNKVAEELQVGDSVRTARYGVGSVVSIVPAGADYEVEVSFTNMPNKKFMAGLSKLKRVEE